MLWDEIVEQFYGVESQWRIYLQVVVWAVSVSGDAV